jgi:protein-S-isoprenylcysteine O-methyltransferase Ste14
MCEDGRMRADNRIGEEEYLVRFFGQEYLDYRTRTAVWIPFIR